MDAHNPELNGVRPSPAAPSERHRWDICWRRLCLRDLFWEYHRDNREFHRLGCQRVSGGVRQWPIQPALEPLATRTSLHRDWKYNKNSLGIGLKFVYSRLLFWQPLRYLSRYGHLCPSSRPLYQSQARTWLRRSRTDSGYVCGHHRPGQPELSPW